MSETISKNVKQEQEEELSFLEKAIAAGVGISFHETDLHIPVMPKSEKLVSEYAYSNTVKKFTSAIDGRQMYEIAFAFDKEIIDAAVDAGLYLENQTSCMGGDDYEPVLANGTSYKMNQYE